MNKKIFFFLVISFVLLTGFNGYATEKKIINIPQMVDYIYSPTDLVDLEENSDEIIIAKVLPDSENVIEFRAYTGTVIIGYTKTQLEVLEVFSGEVKPGDILTIVEPYYTEETSTEIEIHHEKNYNPSVPEQEYIFFLKKCDEKKEQYAGMYYPRGVDKGRYPIIEKLEPSMLPESARRKDYVPEVNHFTNAELSLGELDSTEYREFFNDVIEKYQR